MLVNRVRATLIMTALAAGALALPTSFAGAGTSRPAASAEAKLDELLPDLAMGPTKDLRVVSTGDGNVELRFTSTLVNLGDGPLLVVAERSGRGYPWTVVQETLSPTGAIVRRLALPLSPVWGGDGHNHWHIPGMARYRLLRLDDGSEVGANHKIGFCFFDNKFYRQLPGAPADREFPNDHGCAHGDREATRLRMGLSVGWGDVYRWRIPGQSIDITDLPAGDYRLEGKADGDAMLTEIDPDNNLDWVDFHLSGGHRPKLEILGHASSAHPDDVDHGELALGGGSNLSTAAQPAPAPAPR